LVPKLAILNDIQRRNEPCLRYLTEIGGFRGQLRKSLMAAIPTMSAKM